mmetsp:Transcript_25071/g.30863  ORF Transcript_25071/g.30863 Transcript_25071/m.30863 type:complete len:97 (+) Transcript_25071:154-444(+)
MCDSQKLNFIFEMQMGWFINVLQAKWRILETLILKDTLYCASSESALSSFCVSASPPSPPLLLSMTSSIASSKSNFVTKQSAIEDPSIFSPESSSK